MTAELTTEEIRAELEVKPYLLDFAKFILAQDFTAEQLNQITAFMKGE